MIFERMVEPVRCECMLIFECVAHKFSVLQLADEALDAASVPAAMRPLIVFMKPLFMDGVYGDP